VEISRRRFLVGSAAAVSLKAALASAGIYELVELFADPRSRAEAAEANLGAEQYLPQQIAVIPCKRQGTQVSSTSTEVAAAVRVPPLHSQVVTAKLAVSATSSDVQQASQLLESTLQGLEAAYAGTSSGLVITVAWGLPYFRTFVPQLNQSSTFFSAGTAFPDYLPVDNRASATAGATVRAVIDAVQFASDRPPSAFPGYPNIRLESNDLAVLLRSDSLDNISAAANAIFGTGPGQAGSLFTVTSIRKGFAGGGFTGQKSLPKQMASAAKLPAADHIPETAELFMGFVSTQHQALGQGRIANLESIPGLTDQWPGGYFVGGTTMHLSHLFLDLPTWYLNNNVLTFTQANDRIRAVARPGLSLAADTRVVSRDTDPASSLQDVQAGLAKYGTVGHSASLQPVTRLQASLTDNYGAVYPAGTAIPQRADFNSLDNPFFYSANPAQDGYANTPAASLHFVVFTPTSDAFHRSRRAMDGQYPDGTNLGVDPRSFKMGFNAALRSTHRQNFLVPPRAYRSMPLAEYL
jgi:hypothetical protein